MVLEVENKVIRNGQRVKRLPRTLDLFCGIGGLTLGMEMAGCKSIGGVDNWEEAKATFEHNLKPLKCLLSDLTKTTCGEIEDFFGVPTNEIDFIVGGPPCQGFSTVGKRDLSDPRNQLWKHYFDLVSEIRPAYVVIENVEGLWVADGGKFREQIMSSFREVGYQIDCRLLRSADFGVPQLRKRIIFLGWLSGLQPASFPRPTGSGWATVADAIFDLPPLEAGQSADSYNKNPSTEYQAARRGKNETLENHEAAKHSAHLIEVMKHVPDGGNRLSIPDSLQPKSGFHNSYARLASDKPAVAVTSNMRKPSSARATHPTQHRGLTVREGLRLQSFDDDFVVLGSRTSQYLQVGNAVPPLLAKAIGEELVKAFRSNSTDQLADARGAAPAAVASRSTVQLTMFG